MKTTRMRIKGKKLTQAQMQLLMDQLEARFNTAGFVTGVEQLNSSSIKIGLHMKCFTIDTEKLSYNARLDTQWLTTIRGFKRTSLPTWEQREDFNHIVNDVLDAHKITSNIKSVTYEIRSADYGRVDYWTPETDWEYQAMQAVVELDEELVAEGKQRLKEHRRKKRAQQRQVPTLAPLKLVVNQ